ncbi:TolC family protein [Neolewinella aurantiaca]|uniref:TolC family protein n=1 Tax=Neolewinella aurantiaca TaxID=2602767 RepID=A0A5C7FQL4_9BACT|nr:TolC family protein [Neolewinella aurantiaca]TXF88324.1 TolC family protein [Neolewinella aurantiaca]
MKYFTRQLLLMVALMSGLASLYAQSEPPPVFSLDEAVAYAMSNNNSIRNAQVDILDAEQNVKERLSTGLPQINGSLDFTRYLKVPQVPLPAAFTMGDPNAPESISFQLKNSFTAGLSARGMIFDGSFFVGLRAARASSDYFNLQLENTQRTVRGQVIQAYFPTLLLKTNVAILDNNISNLTKLKDEVSAQYDAGFVEQLDVDRLVLSLNNLRSQRDQVAQQAENALRALKFTLNYPLDEPLRVEDDLAKLETEIDAALLTSDIPYQTRPELRLLDKTIELQGLNEELQKAAYLPTVYANLAAQYVYSGDDFKDGFWAPTVLVGVQANIPIYDFGGRAARVERAKLATQKVINQRNDLHRSIQLEVLNARSTFTANSDRLQVTKDNLALAQRIYDTTQIKYREGVGSSVEVVQAEQALYESQANYLNALYETLVAKEDLFLALGRN